MVDTYHLLAPSFWPNRKLDSTIVDSLFPSFDMLPGRLVVSAKRIDVKRWLVKHCRHISWWHLLPNPPVLANGVHAVDPKWNSYRWCHVRQIAAVNFRSDWNGLTPDTRLLAYSALDKLPNYAADEIGREWQTIYFLAHDEDGCFNPPPTGVVAPKGGPITCATNPKWDYAQKQLGLFLEEREATAAGKVVNPFGKPKFEFPASIEAEHRRREQEFREDQMRNPHRR